ncbi:MAG: AarF/UbiB family protein [Lentisphaeraceae bacterium]|nr:AarF/UbiB family protein [Lentisphaeraceae bacterium]
MNTLKRTLKYAGISFLGASAKAVGESKLQLAIQKRIAAQMVDMKGIPLKVSQMFGMSTNERSELYTQAQQEISPLEESVVIEAIRKVAPDLLEQGTLSQETYCASLGQVNRLRTNDGNEFAVKVQYPDSEKNVELDDKALKLVTSSFSSFSKGFDMKQYQEMIKDELKQELDYHAEMEMQHEFFRIFSIDKDIIIPLSYKKFSSSTCLIMSWEPSKTLNQFLEIATLEQKKEASKLITRFYMSSIFKHGLLHSDPNPGNFGFRLEDGRVKLVVYDFGSVIRLERRTHLDLLALFKMTVTRQNPLSALLAVGFDYDLLEPLKSKLPAMMTVLLEPFISEQRYDLSKWNRKERIADISGDGRWNFMVAAPANLMLLMRSFYGLFYYNTQLTGSIYCRPFLDEAFTEYSKEIEKAVDVFAQDIEDSTEELSKNLIISVKEFGSQKVKLTLPAKSVDNLSTIIPPDVAEKLSLQEISPEDLSKKVRQNAYRPQDIFQLEEGSKEIYVYLV